MRLSPSDIGKLFEEHSEDLLRFFARRVSDNQAAIDLVSETFATALEARNNFIGKNLAEGRPWLFGIGQNLLNHHYRDGGVNQRAMQRLRMDRVELDPLVDTEIDAWLIAAQPDEDLHNAYSQLSPENQKIVWLRIVEEQSYALIADEFEIEESAARARVSRALRQMREVLEDSKKRTRCSADD